MVSGVGCQVSGRYRKQTAEDKGQSVTTFCHLISVIFYLTPDTRHLKRTVFYKLLTDPIDKIQIRMRVELCQKFVMPKRLI